MIFFRIRGNLIKRLKKEYNYYKALNAAKKISDTDKVLFLDVTEIALNRYLYSFLKFFQIEGYTVYLPKNKNLISVLTKRKGEFQYASWLLEEGFVKFGKPKKSKAQIWLEAGHLSNNYFSDFFYGNGGNTYHVPICEYPYLYHTNCWNVKIDPLKVRNRSVFMIGNCERNYYRKFSESPWFPIPDRSTTAEFLRKKNYYKDMKSFNELKEFSVNKENTGLVLIDTSRQFQIGGHQLKMILSSFQLYLALPGIEVPYSHNLAESMSVGCVPVIHEYYAALMYPPLKNEVNCFTYKELDDLDLLINKLLTISESTISEMRREVYSYYNGHLSPKAVVKKVEKNNFEKIYIQAEVISLSYLNR